jgi:4-hydroxybenzoate polyprenyltransferase
MAKGVPFSSGFMLSSIIGFFISVFFVMDISPTWGLTFAIIFVIMFIASVVTLSHIEADDRYGMKELAIHEKGHYRKK